MPGKRKRTALSEVNRETGVKSKNVSKQPAAGEFDILKIRTGSLKPKPNSNESLILFVGTRDINVFDISSDDLDYLGKTLEVAYFSEDNQKVVNTEVRQSKHTKAFEINVNLDIISRKLDLKDCYLDPYKLNLYGKGDFFKNHRDTDRPELMGTVVVILPVPHIGGELRFGDYVPEKEVDDKLLRFIYFDGNLEHSVDEVKDGHRITLIYNVCSRNKEVPCPKVELLELPESVYDGYLKTAKAFCLNKTNVFFGNFHSRNDVYHKLAKDLEKDFKVIEVAMDVWGFEHFSLIKEVQVLVEEKLSSKKPMWDYNDFVKERYRIYHTLFTQERVFSVKTYNIHIKRTSALAPLNTFTMDYYSGYLINPRKLKKSKWVQKE